MPGAQLLQAISEAGDAAGVDTVAVAFYDYETSLQFSFQGDRWFHAASTIKAAVLFGLCTLVARGAVRFDDSLHVRNRFKSAADGSIFRVDSGRDGADAVHSAIGRMMRIDELARVMIIRSSNLATNLLVDYLTVEAINGALNEAEVPGLKLLRGVEDDKAFESGLNNEVTAEGLVRLFRLFCEEGPLDPETREKAMEILHDQEFRNMIPAGLPDDARVAHKTGEISSVCHDAGIITLPERRPYVAAILTEGGSSTEKRQKAVADISRVLFQRLSAGKRENAK